MSIVDELFYKPNRGGGIMRKCAMADLANIYSAMRLEAETDWPL
jgi:hypothetical protein